MELPRGTRGYTLCCGHEYVTSVDSWKPKPGSIAADFTRYGGRVYVRGPCFRCLLNRRIAPELLKHGIRLVK